MSLGESSDGIPGILRNSFSVHFGSFVLWLNHSARLMSLTEKSNRSSKLVKLVEIEFPEACTFYSAALRLSRSVPLTLHCAVGVPVVIAILIICQCPNFLAPGVASPTALLL